MDGMNYESIEEAHDDATNGSYIDPVSKVYTTLEEGVSDIGRGVDNVATYVGRKTKHYWYQNPILFIIIILVVIVIIYYIYKNYGTMSSKFGFGQTPYQYQTLNY